MLLTPVYTIAKNDCGPCAVACALGIEWQEAVRLMWPALAQRPTRSYMSSSSHMIGAVRRHGRYQVHTDRFVSLRDDMEWDAVVRRMGGQAKLAIVKVQWQDVRGFHVVVFDGEYVYENSGNLMVVPFRQYERRPLAYFLLWGA